MGLAAVIRQGVKAASAAVADVYVDVSFEAWVGQDAFGKQQFAPAVLLRGLVQRNPALARDVDGQEVHLLAIVTFLDPVPPNGAAGRHEPIDTRDRFVLVDDGSSGPVVELRAGMLDPETSYPYVTQVGIGR